jgi:hypothetical protein
MSLPPVAVTAHHLNVDMPLANRRCRRVTRMPAKFRDYLPQAQPSSMFCLAAFHCDRRNVTGSHDVI